MSSKKASFDSRDPSYMATDTAENRSTKPHEKTASSADVDALVNWHTTDDPVLKENPIAPDKSSPPAKDASSQSSFYERDTDPGGNYEAQDNTRKTYTGKERRRFNRRTQEDRRSDIRFELDKNNRRKDSGRRENDAAPTFR